MYIEITREDVEALQEDMMAYYLDSSQNPMDLEANKLIVDIFEAVYGRGWIESLIKIRSLPQ